MKYFKIFLHFLRNYNAKINKFFTKKFFWKINMKNTRYFDFIEKILRNEINFFETKRQFKFGEQIGINQNGSRSWIIPVSSYIVSGCRDVFGRLLLVPPLSSLFLSSYLLFLSKIRLPMGSSRIFPFANPFPCLDGARNATLLRELIAP